MAKKVSRPERFKIVTSIWDIVEINPYFKNYYIPKVETLIVNTGRDFYEYTIDEIGDYFDVYEMIKKSRLLITLN